MFKLELCIISTTKHSKLRTIFSTEDRKETIKKNKAYLLERVKETWQEVLSPLAIKQKRLQNIIEAKKPLCSDYLFSMKGLGNIAIKIVKLLIQFYKNKHEKCSINCEHF